MLVADIVDEVFLGTDIMNAYGFVVDLRKNILRIGQEKIKPVSYTHLDVYKRQGKWLLELISTIIKKNFKVVDV